MPLGCLLLRGNSRRNSPLLLVYLQSPCVHTRHAAVTPAPRQVHCTCHVCPSVIPFTRQCTLSLGLTADINFSVVTVGHRRNRAMHASPLLIVSTA